MNAKRGRRPAGSGSVGSREKILRAARELFAKRGFRGTTLRAVATRARVDLALVSYFFGSKDELFSSAVDLPSLGEGLTDLLRDRSPGLGERIVRTFLERVFHEHEQGISALLRAVVGDSSHVPRLRKLIERWLVEETAGVMVGKDARLKAELLGAQMTGLFVLRSVVRVEPLASASVDEVGALFGRAVEAVLGVTP